MTKKTKIIIAVSAVVAVAATITGIAIYKATHKEVNPTEEITPAPEEKPYENLIESEDVFIYHQFEEGVLAVAGEQGITGDIEIPRSYKGAVITEIASNAFKDNTNLRKVTIGYPLMINADAFTNSSVTEIIIKDENGLIPETSVGFSPYCFSDCKQLKSFYCEAYMPGLEPYMFSGCSALETVTLITPTDSIPEYSFKDCSSLTEITLPGTIKSINETAFEGCNNLQTVKGFNGSYVETWAKDQGYTWVGEDVIAE